MGSSSRRSRLGTAREGCVLGLRDRSRAATRVAMSGVPDLDALVRFCRHAEDCGFESLLTAFSFARPDPLTLASALGMLTTKIKFMVAVRSGTISPTLFVQQVNTVASLTGGRICINVVAGHTPDELHYYGDFLEHDQRYARTLPRCAGRWRGRGLSNVERFAHNNSSIAEGSYELS